MKIQIVGIADRGVPSKERLHLSVIAPVDLKYFVVFGTRYQNATTVVAIPRHAYWFTEKLVQIGDQVVLYSSAGVNKSEVRPDGNTNHFLYWGLSEPLWSNPQDCAILFEVSEWTSSAYLK